MAVEKFAVVEAIGAILGLEHSLPTHKRRENLDEMPEIVLISVLVVAVKLFHPFDNVERAVRSSAELGSLSVDWQAWSRLHQEHKGKSRDGRAFKSGEQVSVKERDVPHLSDRKIDEYLDWYEAFWTDSNNKPPNPLALPPPLLAMFPIGRSTTTAEQLQHAEKQEAQSVLTSAMAQLTVRAVISRDQNIQGEPVTRLGAQFKHYREVIDLPALARPFHEAAATLAGVSLATLVQAVFKTELKLQKTRPTKRATGQATRKA